MTSDRRNDIGQKVIVGFLTSVVLIVLGLFIEATWTTASNGNEKAQRNEVSIARIEECVKSIRESVERIEQNVGKIQNGHTYKRWGVSSDYGDVEARRISSGD